jgi:hypothetical protein
MTRPDRDVLASEMAMLDEMLRSIDADRVLERSGLEARRDRLADELAALPDTPKHVMLTFGGAPVRSSEAIQADFAGEAIVLFNKAIATISASLSSSLGETGPLRQAASRQLEIVGTVPGSFGFELELPEPERPTLPGVPGADPMEQSLETTLLMIREANGGNEEQLSELLGELHPRAAKRVHDFVKHVVDRNAIFTMRFGAHRVAVASPEEGLAVLETLREDHIERDDIEVDAELIGVLPEARRFEARLLEDGSLVRGRIDPGVGDPGELLRSWLDQRARLSLRKTTLRKVRASYVLTGIAPSHATA